MAYIQLVRISYSAIKISSMNQDGWKRLRVSLISKTFWIVHRQILSIKCCFLPVYNVSITFLGFGGETAMAPTSKKFIIQTG